MVQKAYHSICAWTFNAGKGGFTPADSRPGWSGQVMDTVGKIKLTQDKIRPRIPDHIELGFEMHYDYEYNEENATRIADTLLDTGIFLAMATPGAHQRFAYGGICSLDPAERAHAGVYGKNSLDIAYGDLKKAWHPDVPPTFVIWNGSFGYDLASVGIHRMYQHLKQSIADLCKHEAALGGKMHMAIEPKPNEGHPAMLLPTVASAIVFWRKLEEEFGIDLKGKGINKEFGHSEMIGLDHVYDTVEEIDNGMLLHMHINSQGYNDGLILGGPGKYDIDHGARINGMNIAIAGLIQEAGYRRWKGHDMQVRAHDTEEQGIDRVVRSILSWDACEKAAQTIDTDTLMAHLANRETAKAEDIMRQAVVAAYQHFTEMYQ
ncbi:MAG: xylose isomerase [Deltaproteobacteria bacterium]|nr:xylose isomerase [Deltaproteobacteria bacterium]